MKREITEIIILFAILIMLTVGLEGKAEDLSYSQALHNLQVAARQAKLSADEHSTVQKSVEKIYELVEKAEKKEKDAK